MAKQLSTCGVDDFDMIRQLLVLTCSTGEVLFKFQGRLSVILDQGFHQLIVREKKNEDFITTNYVGLNDNVTYLLEEICMYTGGNK